MHLNKKKFAMHIAQIATLLYAVCTLFVYLFPTFSDRLVRSVAHLTVATQRSVTLTSFLAGVIQVIIYSYVVGWLFAWAFNKAVRPE